VNNSALTIATNTEHENASLRSKIAFLVRSIFRQRRIFSMLGKHFSGSLT
jgi:hypothetical protein